MNKIYRFDRMLTHLRPLNVCRVSLISVKSFSTDNNSGKEEKDSAPLKSPVVDEKQVCTENNREESANDVKLSGFAQSFKKFSHIDEKEPEVQQTFASLIRHSKFVDLGDPEGKLVIGDVYHVVEDDLYIDFGWKFNCVCRRPVKNGQYYVRGSKVRLRIKDLELSSKFLGATTDLTLLEADCILMGLISSPLLIGEQKMKRPENQSIARS